VGRLPVSQSILLCICAKDFGRHYVFIDLTTIVNHMRKSMTVNGDFREVCPQA
jgi:hypothetical protein